MGFLIGDVPGDAPSVLAPSSSWPISSPLKVPRFPRRRLLFQPRRSSRSRSFGELKTSRRTCAQSFVLRVVEPVPPTLGLLRNEEAMEGAGDGVLRCGERRR